MSQSQRPPVGDAILSVLSRVASALDTDAAARTAAARFATTGSPLATKLGLKLGEAVEFDAAGTAFEGAGLPVISGEVVAVSTGPQDFTGTMVTVLCEVGMLGPCRVLFEGDTQVAKVRRATGVAAAVAAAERGDAGSMLDAAAIRWASREIGSATPAPTRSAGAVSKGSRWREKGSPNGEVWRVQAEDTRAFTVSLRKLKGPGEITMPLAMLFDHWQQVG